MNSQTDDFCQWCYDRGLRYSRPGPWGHAKDCPNALAATPPPVAPVARKETRDAATQISEWARNHAGNWEGLKAFACEVIERRLHAVEAERDQTLAQFRRVLSERNAARAEVARLKKCIREEWDGVAADKILTDVEQLRAALAATARTVELEEALENQTCPICHNTGRYTPHCFKCDDSGEDHDDCPEERDCTDFACIERRRLLATRPATRSTGEHRHNRLAE